MFIAIKCIMYNYSLGKIDAIWMQSTKVLLPYLFSKHFVVFFSSM